MESARLSNERRATYPIVDYGFPVLICLLLSGGFTLLNYYLYQQGFASKILLYLGEKSLLTYHGNPPRLENMGFANPPLPHFFTLLIRNPFVASAIVGSIIATSMMMALYRVHQEKKISRSLFIFLFLYVALSPLSLFTFSQQMPTALLIGLLLLIYHHLYLYCQQGISYNLFMFGLLSALVFLTEFQAVLLIFIFTFSLVCNAFCDKPLMGLSIVFTGLFPVVFFAVSWCYLNWLFLGDPFHFISYWSSALEPLLSFPEKMIHSQTAYGALLTSFRLCYENAFLLLPYYLFIVWMIISPKFMKTIECVTGSILIAPFFLLYIQLFTNFVELNQFFFLIFVVSAVSIRIHLHDQLKGTIFSALFTCSMGVSLCMSFWLPFHHPSSEEKIFAEFLLGNETNGNLDNYRNLIDELHPNGKILLDDTVNYPLVFIVNDPQRFVLPYEYEFDMVLSFPAQFIRYLVVSDLSSIDAVQGRYPMATNGYVPDFSLLGQFGNLFLYEVSKSADHPLTPHVHSYWPVFKG
ncbi:MAG: hypothetical protein JEZ12_20270 [Desulfobacterium sp.]|nr:hypothetical protein [Desulfobacterium sp.]